MNINLELCFRGRNKIQTGESKYNIINKKRNNAFGIPIDIIEAVTDKLKVPYLLAPNIFR